jgi:hypothetical protein
VADAGPRNGDEIADVSRAVRRLGDTPVDVEGTPDDSALDDHLWMRISALVPDYARASVLRLPADVRAYFLTRLFEWESAHDGPDAFVQLCPELLGMVGPAYRDLGLDEAARSFEAYAAAEPTRRMLADHDALPTPADLDVLVRLVHQVGFHDAERIAFVRKRPESFSR